MTKAEEAKKKKEEKLKAELKRLDSMKVYERNHKNYALICGIDEAGRGPFAGPVAAGAVILDYDDPEKEILYLNDSKQVTAKRRDLLYDEICSKAIAWGVGIVDNETIDEINILQATYKAMRMALEDLSVKPDFILADAVHIPEVDIPQEGIIKGDAKSVSIAAGSIIAKVTRDRIMMEYDRLYPEYGFASNKGYGTRAHIEALKKYGPTPIHRKTFIHDYV